MAEKVTIGGERLGSGKKMKAEIEGFNRSTHNLSTIFRSTMAAGTLVPFLKKVALPGDTWDIDLDSVILTHPTIGPLFGSFKAQYDVFIAPMRLYNRQLHNNKVNIGLKMQEVKFPIVVLKADYISELPTTNADNLQINPSCIFKYLGISGVGLASEGGGTEEREFNAIPWIAYWDIYKNYYANKQEQIGAVIHTPPEALVTNVEEILIGANSLDQFPGVSPYELGETTNIVINLTASPQPLNQIIFNTSYGIISGALIGEVINQTVTTITIAYDFARWGRRQVLNWYYIDSRALPVGEIKVQTFPLDDIDDMREAIMGAPNNVPFKVNDSGGAPNVALSPWQFALERQDGGFTAMMQSQEGLGIKCYQSDIFNNWLDTEFITGSTGINDLTKVDTSDGYFNIDALILAKKTYDMLNKIAMSGGTYQDWMQVTYDVKTQWLAETPIYCGGLSKELIFQEVVSNSESGAENQGAQPLGTLAGRGILGRKHKGGHVTIKVTEPSYIIGIVSLTPRIDYSQGNDWDIHLKTMNDLHKPDLDQIGFQDLLQERKAWWTTYWDNAAQKWVTRATGKQPAWIEYMTDINKVYGNFAIPDNQMWMTLNRRFTPEAEGDKYNLDDDTTYIDPAKYNQIFAQTSLDSQNFWTQIAMDIEVRRVMSAKIMPVL